MRNFRLLPGPRSRRGFGGVIAFGAVIAVAVAMRAQKSLAADPPADLPAGTQPADELVSMDFPADGVELSLLADIVTRRLHIPIVYDEQLKGKKVIIRVPSKVPESALLGILQSALRMKQMALVDAEQPGWKQIVAAPNLAAIAKPGKAADADSPVAQVFILTHADPAKLAELLRPFLSQPGGYIQAETGQKVLIVGDYPSNVRRVEQLIGQLDSEAPPVETSFIQLKQTEAPQLVASVTSIISNREAYQWGNAAGSGIYISSDEQTNQVVVIAPPQRMKEIEDLIAGLDKAPELQTRVYRLKSVSPERVDQILRSLLDPSMLKHGYQAGFERDSQLLVVSATPAVHSRIDDLLKELDVPAPDSENPIQFYKLKNTKAADVLATISGLLGDSGSQGVRTDNSGSPDSSSGKPPGVSPQSSQDGGLTSSLNGGAAGNAGAGTPGSLAPSTYGGLSGLQTGNLTGVGPMGGTSPGGNTIGSNSDIQNISPVLGGSTANSSDKNPGVLSVRNRNATVAADVNTNSIIVVGPPPVQQIYADLIHRLDQRRPQVQIECTIVTLDTTNDTSFGVDIGRIIGFTNGKMLTLSSFGVSTADPLTGALTPIAAPGGTFALLSPKIADVVMRALENDSHARLVSAPQLLVNDNGTGKLESVAQEPYAVILDASSTQSLTSLGGLAQAGTSISVEPHISEADYLQLSYSIELSNFTGTAQNGLPPPSEKNSIDSDVTIPDGYTIVVGGLTTKNYTHTVNTIPIIGQIPVINTLIGSHDDNKQDTTLFVFIRPVILRDDQFEDLKYLSSQSAEAAGIPSDFPQSEPIAMH